MNDNERIEQFSEPPKIVQRKDIAICIMEFEIDFPNLGTKTINSFIYCLPYKEEEGGLVEAFNPLHPDGKRRIIFPTKQLLYRAFNQAILKGLGSNSTAFIIYKGIIGVDITYKGMYNKWII